MTPKALRVLRVMLDGKEHSADEFKDGDHGFMVDAVSQRIGEIRRAGFVIEGGRGGQKMARYRLVKS